MRVENVWAHKKAQLNKAKLEGNSSEMYAALKPDDVGMWYPAAADGTRDSKKRNIFGVEVFL